MFSRRIFSFISMLLMGLLSHSSATAETIQAPSVDITENTLGIGSDAMVTPAAKLNGRALSIRREATLGETLTDIPGVSSSYFGPNASRPIIRGMEGDRVQIMQNGTGILDASSLSPDHAVGVDPLIAEQIEVIRGPASLLYGTGNVGGVVNVVDHRIPKEPLDGAIGRGEARFGGADNERSGAAVVDVGNGLFAIHMDAYKRKTDDLSIPKSAADKLKAIDGGVHTNNNQLLNSAATSDGGALGASLSFEHGYAGVSFARSNSVYGTVAEPDVKIDMRNDRWDFASELFDLNGIINRLKLRMAYTDYQHQEINNGNIDTIFLNTGIESTLEATHKKIGNMGGVIGLQINNTRFQALGDEAFIPPTHTSKQGIYILEELPIDTLKLSLGGRVDDAKVSSAGGGLNNNFGAASTRTFTSINLSAGALYTINNEWSLDSNISHTERAPSQNELFAHGPHLATNQYEIGDTNLNKEISNGLDAKIQWRTEKHSASISVFYNRFTNFITLFETGSSVDTSGSMVGTLAEAYVKGVPASFKGFETQAKFRIYEGQGDMDLNLRADYVQATDESTNKPLPRITPMRIGTGIDYNFGDFASKIDVLHGFKQNRVAENETSTDGYTLINATFSYHLTSALKTPFNLEVFAKARNLLNQDIRDHSSFLKEIAPMGGRSILFGLRGEF